MENQFLNEILSEQLGETKPAEQGTAQPEAVEQTQEVASEPTEVPTDEISNTQEASVEEPQQETPQQTVEQPVEGVQQEQPQVEESAWYDKEPGETTLTSQDYTEKFQQLNIDLEKPESIIQAIESAKTDAVPEALNNQVVQDFAKYINDGGDIKEFMDTYVAMDVSKMENRDVFKEYLKTVGVGDEDLNAALKEFDEMPKYKQTLQTQRLRSELQSAQQTKLQDLSQRQEAQRLEQQKFLEQTQRNVETSIDGMIGQSYKGLKFDGNMAKAVKNEIINNFTLTKKDGTPDIQKLVDIAIWLRYGQDLVKANVTQAINKGKTQVLDKLSNPSSNPNQVAPPSPKMSAEDFAKDYFERGLLGRGKR